MNQYAIYKGDELLHLGTAQEVAKAHGIKPRTVYYYQTPSHQKKMAERAGNRDYITIIKLEG